jgi:hypothetical protein
MKQFFKSNWKHFTVIGIIILVTMFYFNLQFQGYGLKQHDIEQYYGASHEAKDFKEHSDKQTLWTNSMFGGMPTTQIYIGYEGNYFKNVLDNFLKIIHPPAGLAILYMLGFYVLMICLNINPFVGLLGAIAFGFSSYDMIIIQAGHNTKALAVAFMAPVVGAFIVSYQRNLKWGLILSALFMAIELSTNHLQVTYYLGILLVAIGIVMFLNALIKKDIKRFLITSLGVSVAYFLALMVNYGNISMTKDYAKHTIRGGNDLTISPNGSSNADNSTSGLDKDYITQWSYGVGESFTLISPYVKGGGSVALSESPFVEDVDKVDLSPEQRKNVMSSPVYWGEQPMTSGPVYIGVIIAFLAVLGLVFLSNPIKWALFAVTLLTLSLSWGKNFMGLTDFFLENVPGYNKFRAVTIILVMVELCVPILGVLFLDLLIREREKIKEKKKLFLISSVIFVFFLVVVKAVGLGDGYASTNDQIQINAVETNIRNQILGMDPATLKSQYNLDVNNSVQLDQFIKQQSIPYVDGFEGMKKVRETIYDDSMNRSILFTILALGLLAALFYTEIKSEIILISLVVLTALDLIPVANNYLGNQEQGNGFKYWTEKGQTLYPMEATLADRNILDSELTLNPSLRELISKAEKEGVSKALELELSGAAKSRVIDAYKFAALNRNTNYRVFDLSGGFNSANSSYFHKALGGYHGAKLRNIQNLFDFHITTSNYKVYDMLNVKYFISNGNQVQPNPSALGNAWFVSSIRTVANPNDEIRSLGSQLSLENAFQGSLLVNGILSTKTKAYTSDKIQYVLKSDTIDVPMSNGLTEGMEAMFVMDLNGKTNLVPIQTLEMDTAKSFLKLVKIKNAKEFKPKQEAIILSEEFSKVGKLKFNAQGQINMTSYSPNKIMYSSNTNSEQFAVFSEVYYPEGWIAKIDGKEVDIVKTDYLLRGLKVPAGKHKIEFTFDLPKYHTSVAIASIASILIILALIAGVFTDIKKRNEV